MLPLSSLLNECVFIGSLLVKKGFASPKTRIPLITCLVLGRARHGLDHAEDDHSGEHDHDDAVHSGDPTGIGGGCDRGYGGVKTRLKVPFVLAAICFLIADQNISSPCAEGAAPLFVTHFSVSFTEVARCCHPRFSPFRAVFDVPLGTKALS